MASLALEGPTVSIDWLAARLEETGLVVLDASMQSVTALNASPGSHGALQIPGTQVFDFDKTICDTASSLPHMMPTPEVFEREVRALGVHRDSVIVVYDRVGVYSSPRAWWMFKAMGHEQVAVLDGGLTAWIEAGLPCQPVASQSVERGDFIAHPHASMFCDTEHVATALGTAGYAVLDARAAGRFFGREPEPRAGLRPGHMPGALNLPFSEVQERGRMRAPKELAAILAEKAAREQKLIMSCGSGVTACILALAAELAGYPQIAVYDGSWSEWGQPSSRPVVTH